MQIRAVIVAAAATAALTLAATATASAAHAVPRVSDPVGWLIVDLLVEQPTINVIPPK
ncbi:hypothetical protein [Spongiactinospora sp. TRM90649]|uniref:hypothetical protein n=1 Tax=Spongiactinospora sp. TRM90649 TaxID=3031114 RepID=UPI0023F940E7|nr:hypothetical protein [Spongiactinospora sp. TRM90649]MDF5756449.1 hypothetical protein [Spongiactinospora sp. TRM90649]